MQASSTGAVLDDAPPAPQEPANEAGAPDPQDAGVGALVLIARFHSIGASYEQIVHDSGSGQGTLTAEEIELSARKLGLKTRRVVVAANRLPQTPCPALMLRPDGRHVILVGCDSTRAMLLELFGSAP